MAVVRHASSGVGSSTTSTVSVAIPTNSVGDILMLALTTYGTPTTPTGWTLVGSDTTSAVGVYVYWQYVATVQSGTVTISLTGSTGARAHIDSYTGASTSVPTVVVTGGSASTTTTVTASSQTYGAFVYWAVGRGAGSSTMSGEASSDGTWVASETSDTFGGALGMTVVDGPIGQGVTASLTGVSSVAAVYGSVAVALAAPVATGVTGANSLTYGLTASASTALQPVLTGATTLSYTLSAVASMPGAAFVDHNDGTLDLAGGFDNGDGTAQAAAVDDGDGTAVLTTTPTGGVGLTYTLSAVASTTVVPITGSAALTYALSSTVSGTSLPPTGATALTYALSAVASWKVPPAYFATGATGLTYALSAVASTQVVVTVNPVGGRTYDLRLVAYQPLGARIGPIPDLGFTVTDTAAGPTLQAQISTVIAGTLPQNLEIAVEWWHVSFQQWQEARDSRFAITQVDADDRDRTGTVTITGLGLGAFLLAAAQLNGVDPYADATGVSEVSLSNTATHVSGTTWTWTGHVLSNGDRVRINSVGNAKGINAGSVYYVINPTTNTFQLARGATSTTPINAGTATNVSMSRVDTRIVFSDSHKFRKNDSVSVLGGGTLGLTDGTQYFVVNPTASTIQLASQPGGVPIELNHGATNVTQVYRYLDGQRVFTNATPGTVMDAVFGEARSRGWGVGADGVTTIVHGWTTTAGADGVPWTKMADDPTTPGISIGFQPGTPGTQVLQALLDNQYAEWYCVGRIIYLVNYGTGLDRSVQAAPVRIGTTAAKVGVQTDLTSMRNAVTVRGTGPILTTQVATGSPWGRLEVYETAQGATSKTLATKQAATDLAANQAPTVAYTVTENAQEAAGVPNMHFYRGDWVAVQLAGTGWTRLRVVGWSLVKAPSGLITSTTNLENIKKTLTSKLAHKTTAITAGLGSTGTPGGGGGGESDNRTPTYPLGVTVTTVGFFAADNSAEATATVSWLPVVADQDGGEVQAVQYDVWIRPEGAFNGQSVGRTSGLSLDVTPLGAGRFFEVSVRAQSSTGKWGELSPELEFQTAWPVAVPNPPSAPIVSGKLGSVRVAWDGNLVDPTNGPGAAPNGFAYVYAAYCTTQNGTYIPAGSNMGNAGYTPITGLTVGSSYWFALFAVNTVGVVSAMSPAVQFTVVGVKGPDIEANSVTANSIAAGAITADKLDVGTVPSGTPVNRVPMPLTAATFWGLACSAAPNGVVYSTATGATAGTSGITLTAVASNTPQVWVTRQQSAPASRVLHLSGLATAGLAVFLVREWDGVGGVTSTAVTISPAGTIYNLAGTTTLYAVALQIPATVSSGVDTVETATVFEAIGTAGGGQAAQLTPSGMRLFDNNGNLAMDLTTASQQFINIYDNSGAEPVTVAALDATGDASFVGEVSAGGFDISGALFTDPSQPASLINASPNGGGWGATPLLDIGGHGVVYDVTWPNLNGRVVSTQYQRIAQDVFVLEDGRTYQFNVDLGGLATTNASGQNIYVELQFKVGSPNTSVIDGTSISHAVVYNGTSGYWVLPPVTFAASASQASLDVVNRLLPANVPIYWQINTNLSATPSSSYTFAGVGLTRGFTVIDIGSTYAVRPSATDPLADVHDYSTSGGSSGTSSGGTVASTTTKTWRASWSRTWHDSGNTIVTGTGQYTNGASMYQGNGVTPMGSQFGFAALGLSGKTITGCQLYMLNAYQAYSGKSALLGTHGNSSPPATYTGARQNGWNVPWGQGQGKWVTVPSSLWASIASGSIRGFSLGVDGSNGSYGYWEGATQNYPPILKISFH